MKQASNFIIVITAIILILILGKGILIPFVFAVIFWFLTREIRKGIYKLPYTKRFIPFWLSNILVFSLIILVLSFISKIISNSIQEVMISYSKYEPNLTSIIDKLSVYFDTDLIESGKNFLGDFNYGSLLGNVANSLSSLLGDTFMILLYALFIFLEESSLIKKVRRIFNTKEKWEKYDSMSTKIENSISNYLRLKTFVSILTGFLSYFVLTIVGIDSAPFWAFLIFLLNFIPTIGSMVGTIFPAIFSLLQFGTFQPFLIVLFSVGLIQLAVGNYLEPKLFGKSLNVSPLVTIVSLSLWGQIWGITGMLLSVPITVIIIIICSQFEKTRTIAILLSESGEIDDLK